MAVTRDEVKAAAWRLLRTGNRPTTTNVREQLEGRGSQQTLVAALADFWVEVGNTLTDSEMPSAVLESARSNWKLAMQAAGDTWDQERAVLKSASEQAQASLAESERQRDGLADALQTSEEELAAANGVAEQRRQELERIAAALERQRAATVEKENEVRQLNDALRDEREVRERDEAELLRRIDAANQCVKDLEARNGKLSAGIENLRGEIVSLKLDRATKTQALADLENRLAEERKSRDALSSKLDERGARLADAAGEIGRLTSELTGLERRLAKAEDEAGNSQRLVEQHRMALDERTRELAILQTRLELSEKALGEARVRRDNGNETLEQRSIST